MTTTRKLGTTELLYNCAVRMGLQPTWIKQGRLLAIKTPIGEQYLYGARSMINSELSCNLTRNKFTARLILQRYGLPNIAFLKTSNQAKAEAFLAMHSKIIVKPLTGSNSHDVHIVESPEQLAAMDLSQYILERYVAGKEMRYLVLDNKVIAVHESKYGESVAEDRELERISYPASAWDTDLAAMALKTASILRLRFAAVDYMINAEGEAYILEVNSAPGMKWFHAPTTGPKIDVAGQFLGVMLNDMRSQALPAPEPLGVRSSVAYS